MSIVDRLMALEAEQEAVEALMYEPSHKISKAMGIPSYYYPVSYDWRADDMVAVKLEDVRDTDCKFILFPASVIDEPETLEDYCIELISTRIDAAEVTAIQKIKDEIAGYRARADELERKLLNG